MKQNVILIELNELTPRLIFRFMKEGKLPNFQRFFDESQTFTTDAEEQGENLNPWIQWVTVHTGLPYEEHGVFLLGEGAELGQPTIGDLASAAGLGVWLCGSMNIRPRTEINGAFMPDAWATDAQPQPSTLEPYFRFVSRNVQEHTNENKPLSMGDYFSFLRFMATHGLSASTVSAIAQQLLRERSGRYGWKRVSILDDLQWDVFQHFHKKLQPQLSTFFLNSVAHLQHTHWRNMEPEQFKLQPSAAEQDEFEQAVLFGYQQNDQTIGRFLDLADPDTTLIFCTALSQQPCLEWEDEGAKRFYRPRDFAALMDFAGVTAPHECVPVMSEEFWVEFENETAAKEGEQQLAALRVGDEQAFALSRKGERVYTGCRLFSVLDADAVLEHRDSGARTPFRSLLYEAESLKSGVHHPDGLLWIREPSRRHTEHPGHVPLTSVAPTVLSLLGVDIPAAMPAKALL